MRPSTSSRVVSAPVAERVDLWTIEQAAEYLGLKERAIYRLIAEDRIPVVRIGRRVYFRKRDLDKWIQDRSIGPGLFPFPVDNTVVSP